MNLKKTALASAVAISLGAGMAAVPTAASAAIVSATFDGLFTMLNSSGAPTQNTSYPYYGDTTWGYGLRTQISGTFTFNTSTGAGSATVNPFQFFAAGPAVAHDITMQAIGDGVGGTGTLVAGGMLFDWNGNNNISVGLILDAAGLFGALPTAGTSTVISGVGAVPASDGINKGKFPIGAAPMATTTWNTDFNTNPACAGSATCLTSNDAVGGSPMDNGPFPGFNANFDITSVHVTNVEVPAAVPVPAAVWLFGSGLLGLVGVARRKS
jgi:hypothetical protein